MAKQSMNFELIQPLKDKINLIEDVMIPGIKNGISNTKDLCTKVGSAKLTASFDAAEGGLSEVLKALDELLEVLHNMVKQYEKLENAV